MLSTRLIWSVVLTSWIFAIVVIVWTNLENKRINRELDRLFEPHLESIASLVEMGAHEAAAATDLLYAWSELRLQHAAQQPLPPDADLPDSPTIWLSFSQHQKSPGGYWGPVEPDAQTDLLREIQQHPSGLIFEGGQAKQLGLYCAWFELEQQKRVVCRGLAELEQLRRNVGLGPLLSGVQSDSVRYLVIQDETGILARSASGRVSSWRSDAALAEASRSASPTFRQLKDHQGEIFEGLLPFALPDGTWALLRVGIDASAMLSLKADSRMRQRMLNSVLILLALGVSLALFVLARAERRRLSAEKKLAQRLQNERHLEMLGQLAASVAHEVRNPLNTIKMAAKRLSRELRVDETEKESFEHLIQTLTHEVDRVNAVVTEFTQLGRPLELKRERQHLGELLNNIVTRGRLRAGQENKQIRVQVDARMLILVDAKRFDQIMQNLVNNALDAVLDGGSVCIDARQNGRDTEILIHDDGAGIQPELLDKVTKPFVTTKARGTGLGLSITQRLVEAHGGKLEISSVPAQGTQVRLTFPGD